MIPKKLHRLQSINFVYTAIARWAAFSVDAILHVVRDNILKKNTVDW